MVAALAAALASVASAALPGVWQSLASTTSARQEVSYVALGGKMYLAGGALGTTLAPHEVYDPATNAWTTLTQLGGPSSPRTARLDHIQSVALSGKIYYVGGLDDWPGPPSAKVYVYDPATDSFTMGADMLRPRGAGGVVAHDAKIYVLGGLARDPSDSTKYIAVPWVDVYDPATNSWAPPLASMPTARDHFQAAVVDGKIYAIGGRDKSVIVLKNVNEVYDVATNAWATGKAPLPTARGGYAMARLGRELFVIGGEGPDGSGGTKTFDNVEAYNVDTNTWRSLAPMPNPRHGISAAVCNGGIYIAAGGAVPFGGSPSSVHDVLFPDGTATSCGSSGPGTGPPPPTADLDPQPPGPTLTGPVAPARACWWSRSVGSPSEAASRSSGCRARAGPRAASAASSSRPRPRSSCEPPARGAGSCSAGLGTASPPQGALSCGSSCPAWAAGSSPGAARSGRSCP
jgi:N-acetylneuraminic acid mutarotase